jgi:hypothetical protein
MELGQGLNWAVAPKKKKMLDNIFIKQSIIVNLFIKFLVICGSQRFALVKKLCYPIQSYASCEMISHPHTAFPDIPF